MHRKMEARYEMWRHWRAVQAWKASEEPHRHGHVRHHARLIMFWNRVLVSHE